MGMLKEFREFAVKGSVIDLAVGVVIGLAGSLAAGRLLSAYLYGVTSRDPWSIAVTIAVLGGIVLLTLGIALRRIAGHALAPLLADER